MTLLSGEIQAHARRGIFKKNVAQQGDSLKLFATLSDECSPLMFFDPQYRGVLDKLKLGNEGARQKGRSKLPAMTKEYIAEVLREIARVLVPSCYCVLWSDTHHLRVADVLKCVDLISWDHQMPGMGKRSRRRSDFALILQRPPVTPSNWTDHSISSKWVEKVDRKLHTHVKPIGLIKRLIGAVTLPGDLLIDPAAGSFVAMHAALNMKREFIGVDLVFNSGER
jgi:site-specific DNA-methyltransferase (adenine-specific)